MKKLLIFVVAGMLILTEALADEKKASSQVGDRVVSAAVVLKEIAGIPEKGIPTDLLNKCVCVAVIPGVKKVGFFVGGSYGKGVIPPTIFRIPGS